MSNLRHKTLTRWPERGFTLTELTIATLVLLVGSVAVMQLVPAAMQSNLRNRYDTTATVIAQRELDQMITQSLTAISFVDADGCTIALGDATKVNQIVGGPVVAAGSTARINFNGAAVANYNCTYTDLNDAARVQYEVRWAVITDAVGGLPISKRFIVGAWRRDPRQTAPPVTIEGWVQK